MLYVLKHVLKHSIFVSTNIYYLRLFIFYIAWSTVWNCLDINLLTSVTIDKHVQVSLHNFSSGDHMVQVLELNHTTSVCPMNYRQLEILSVFIVTHIQPLSHTHTYTPTHSHTLPHTPTHSHTLPHTPTHSHTLPHTPTHSHTLPHTPTHSHTLPHFHIHIHTNTLLHTHSLIYTHIPLSLKHSIITPIIKKLPQTTPFLTTTDLYLTYLYYQKFSKGLLPHISLNISPPIVQII